MRPIRHRDAYNRGIYLEVLAWMREALFDPIVAVLDEHHIKLSTDGEAIRFDEFGRVNSMTAVIEAGLRAGTLRYSKGVFSGEFSSAITRELKGLGARFSAVEKTFRLTDDKIPMELRGILADAAAKSQAANSGVLRVLDAAQANIGIASPGIKVRNAARVVFDDLAKQFTETTAAFVEEAQIGVAPTLDGYVQETLERELTNNVELGIKNFASERIPELRARVQENVFKFGGRSDRLAKIIESEFGIAKRKAEFLADQEIGLLVSKYRAARYKSIGLNRYTWSTSHDNRVRETHKELDGHEFNFDTKANVSPKGTPARYCNPGEDWRCRCVPIPLIDLEAIAAA